MADPAHPSSPLVISVSGYLCSLEWIVLECPLDPAPVDIIVIVRGPAAGTQGTYFVHGPSILRWRSHTSAAI
jgi:hypothetical protein